MKQKKTHKTNAMRILDKEKIQYKIHTYAWEEQHLDSKEAANAVGVPRETMYKTLIAEGDKTGVIVACLPSNNEIDLKKLAQVSYNKKVMMLPMKNLEKTTGYIRGGCSPIGMTKLFPTYVATAAKLQQTIIVSAGKRGMQMELGPSDLIRVTNGVYADF